MTVDLAQSFYQKHTLRSKLTRNRTAPMRIKNRIVWIAVTSADNFDTRDGKCDLKG
ncbi:hypothetical protein BH10ACI2_BH10ACI2_10420 [soil metagenome]